MKRNAIILSTILALAAGSAAHAATPGAYAGLGLGADHAKLNVLNKADSDFAVNGLDGKISKHYSSLAGRIFAGYNFNEYLGLEAGYNAFGTSKQSIKYPENPNQSAKYKLSSFDVRGKAYLPLLDNSANVYGIAGVAYAKQDVDANLTENGLRTYEPKSANRFRPVVGVGANYNINPQVTAGVEYTRLQGIGSMDKDAAGSVKSMPNVDTLMFTVAYNFA